MHVSAVVLAEVILTSDSNNKEQLFINLATVMGRRISIIRLRKAVAVVRHFKTTSNSEPVKEKHIF